MNLTSSPIDKFLSSLRQSGLLDEDTIQQSWHEFRNQSDSDSPDELAEFLVQKNLITAWHASKLVKGRHKGFFLGRYKLLRLLGRGGMSTVYLAEHTVMKRQSAIKVLPYKLIKDSTYLPRFYREAQAVAALDHPNIVRAYDIDHVIDGSMEIHFLVMEYVPGRNLYELIKHDGPLNPKLAAEYIRQGALGLESAHQAGMVHRDVKPGNFLVDHNGTVKLMDLGLARIKEGPDDHSLTVANEEKVLGTADYLAPEQAVDSHKVDPRADIYGLGCTMFFLLTGQAPFDEGTLAQRLMAHQSKDPPPLSNHRSDVPPELEAILRKMMAKKPQARIQTAAEVSHQLEDWLRSVGSGPASQGGRPPVPQRPAESSANADSKMSDFLSDLERQSNPSRNRTSIPYSDKTPRQKSPGSSGFQLSDSGDSKTSVHSSGRSSIVASHRSSHSSRNRKASKMPIYVAIVVASIVIGCGVIYTVMKEAQRADERNDDTAIVTEPSGDQDPQQNGSDTGASAQPAMQIEGDTILVGTSGNFASLSEAFAFLHAPANSATAERITEIRLSPGLELEDSLKIDHSMFLGRARSLRIAGDATNPAVLRSDGKPLVSLNAVENLTIANLVLDCEELPVGVELAGFLTQTSFENVVFRNLGGVGVLARGVSGLNRRPFSLTNCRFESDSAGSVGVRFEATTLLNTQQIVIRESEFVGPFESGIVFSGSQGKTWDVEIAQSILHDVETGILLEGQQHDISRLQVRNNTFHKFGTAVHFQSGPIDSCRGISFLQNLFVDGRNSAVTADRSGVSADEIAEGATPSRSNWSTGPESDSENALDIFENNGRVNVEDLTFVSTDPQSSSFLKPQRDAFGEAVENPVNNIRYLGAVAP